MIFWSSLWFFLYILLVPGSATGGAYTSSQHGMNADRRVIDAAFPYTTLGHCAHCHEQHASIDDAEPSPPAAEGASSYTLFRTNFGLNKNELCFACHETFNFSGNLGYGRYDIYQGKIIYNNSSHNSSINMVWSPDPSPPGPPFSASSTLTDPGNCHNCHNPHGYDDGSGLIPGMLFSREESLCQACHDGSQASKNVTSLFTTKASRHPAYTYAGRHSETEGGTPATDYGITNRHSECVDCHNPHVATSTNPIDGTGGVDPANTSAGLAPATYTQVTVTDPDQQYKICFKCHSNWAGAGLSSNQAEEFNTANDSFHWVEKDKYTYTVNTGSGKGIWQNAEFNLTDSQVMIPRPSFTYTNANLRTLALRCSDCHGPDGANGTTVPEGPHGSNRTKILKVPSARPTYTQWSATTRCKTASSGNTATCTEPVWCFNCHASTFSNTGFYEGSNNLHLLHLDKAGGQGGYCQDCHIAVPHGQTGDGTANQRQHLLKPSVFTEGIDGETSGNYDEHDTGANNWVIPGCT